MMGMSKKRIAVACIVGLLVWMASSLVQVFSGAYSQISGNLFSPSCYFTGYPFARCVSENQILNVVLLISVNIIFWQIVIVGFFVLINKIRKG